eukprot:scaffold2109_cov188-Amphora_coffeaeformis.AAC.13
MSSSAGRQRQCAYVLHIPTRRTLEKSIVTIHGFVLPTLVVGKVVGPKGRHGQQGNSRGSKKGQDGPSPCFRLIRFFGNHIKEGGVFRHVRLKRGRQCRRCATTVGINGLLVDDDNVVVVPLLLNIVVVPLPAVAVVVEEDGLDVIEVDVVVVDVDPDTAVLVDWEDKDLVACPPVEDAELVFVLSSSLLFVDVDFWIVLSVRSARERRLVCKDPPWASTTVVKMQATQKIPTKVKFRLIMVIIVRNSYGTPALLSFVLVRWGRGQLM